MATRKPTPFEPTANSPSCDSTGLIDPDRDYIHPSDLNPGDTLTRGNFLNSKGFLQSLGDHLLRSTTPPSEDPYWQNYQPHSPAYTPIPVPEEVDVPTASPDQE